jgi:hypothetical protein
MQGEVPAVVVLGSRMGLLVASSSSGEGEGWEGWLTAAARVAARVARAGGRRGDCDSVCPLVFVLTKLYFCNFLYTLRIAYGCPSIYLM